MPKTVCMMTLIELGDTLLNELQNLVIFKRGLEEMLLTRFFDTSMRRVETFIYFCWNCSPLDQKRNSHWVTERDLFFFFTRILTCNKRQIWGPSQKNALVFDIKCIKQCQIKDKNTIFSILESSSLGTMFLTVPLWEIFHSFLHNESFKKATKSVFT